MTLLIYGAGGLGREVWATMRATGLKASGFIVDEGFPVGEIRGLAVRSMRMDAALGASARFILAVGDGRTRQQACRSLGAASEYIQVVHPAAMIGPHVSVGAGAMIIGPVSITTDVAIGNHVLINPGCTIAHDCMIAAFVNMGPSCSLAGRVILEEGASLGVGASVAPGVVVGAWATVGAGAVVLHDVEPGTTVVGVPARPIRRTADAQQSTHSSDEPPENFSSST